ncbi:MAG: mannosyltransferase [Bacteroidota bacterium]
MERFLRVHKISLLLGFIAALFYASFAYELVRTDFAKLISLYSALFFLSWKLIQLEQKNFWFLAGAALLLRLVFFGAIPNLSQDFYRFIWDGRMLVSGWNSYLYLPEILLAEGNTPISQGNLLYEGMGELSAGNYTNYPPLNQLIFALAGLLAGKSILGSVIVMRIVIIAADLGVLYFGKKLLEKFDLPGHRIFWYILNPLVIIELTGNLHFEGVMAFFLVWSLYLLHSRKWILSAIAFAASVLLKLIPLLFLPLLLKYFISDRNDKGKLGLARLMGYYFIVGIVVISGFIPFLSSEFISSFSSSLGLWFRKFEFNASIYYLVRWVGFQVKGYNIIETAGKALPLVTVLVLAGLAFFRENSSLRQLISTMLLGITAYFFLATTVHPWYLMIPLLLSVFTRFRYMLVWSFLIVLSYYTYSTPEFSENLWLIAFEYLLVFGLFGYELFNFRKEKVLRGMNYSEE